MRADDGMMVVRAELCDRLDNLQKAAARMNVRDFAQRIGSIRTVAAAYGLAPVVRLADAFERAVRAEPRVAHAAVGLDQRVPARVDEPVPERVAAPEHLDPRAVGLGVLDRSRIRQEDAFLRGGGDRREEDEAGRQACAERAHGLGEARRG